MTTRRRVVSGLILVAVVLTGIAAAALAKLSHPPVWAGALIAGVAFAAGLILDPFKKIAADWIERPGQQYTALLAHTRMHNRAGRLQRVRECTDALALGVHPAARADDASSDTERLPLYVRRDVQAKLARLFSIGGMVIIEGASTAGKSRMAYQCMREYAGERWLIVPAGPSALQEIAKAAVPLKNAVVWLDDVEHYFAGGGLDAAVLDGICPPGSADVLVLATLRAEARNELTAVGLGSSTVRAIEEVLRRVHIISLDRALTESEKVRAEELRTDLRIAAALDQNTGAGFAEYIAAAPAALDRWESARRGQHPIAGAIISAAIDARRAGYQSSISRPFLETLYEYYLDARTRNQLNLPSVDEALVWASQPVKGASACLNQIAPDIFEPFDYLVDHVQRVSSTRDIPTEVWPALISHADVSDLPSLGSAALGAGQPDLGEKAFRRAADAGYDLAMVDLGDLLKETGRAEEAEQWYRRAADAGLRLAMDVLGGLLKETGRAEEAEQWYRRAADAGYDLAMDVLGDLLKETGRAEEAEQWYRRAADAGLRLAMDDLGNLLQETGRAEEAEQWYRRRRQL